MKAHIFELPADVSSRLADLGLDQGTLVGAVERGLAAAMNCTANHPSNYPGIVAWGETVCALREGLLPRGWYRQSEANLSLTVNRPGSVAIVVATGDEYTGRSNGTPCTKSKKGPRVVDAVNANAWQLEMFPLPPTTNPSTSDRATWLLLIHRDAVVRETRAELSCPISISEEGKVDAWHERILLGSLPFDSDSIDIDSPSDGPEQDFDVEIKRRG